MGDHQNPELHRLAAEVKQTWVLFQEACASNRRRYPREEFLSFASAVRRYAEASREAPLLHREVVVAVQHLTDFVRLERKRVPGEVLREADSLECLLFLGFDPYYEGDEPPDL